MADRHISDLLPISKGKIGDGLVETVNARKLHAYLEVGKDFSNWIKARISTYGFTDGVDFLTEARSPELASGNRGASIEYHLTLDMAKELAMVERNEKGKEARRYFIECERIARGATDPGAIEQRPWHQRPLEERNAELRTADSIGKYGNRALAWWYLSEVSKVATFPRFLLPAWHQNALDVPVAEVSIKMPFVIEGRR